MEVTIADRLKQLQNDFDTLSRDIDGMMQQRLRVEGAILVLREFVSQELPVPVADEA